MVRGLLHLGPMEVTPLDTHYDQFANSFADIINCICSGGLWNWKTDSEHAGASTLSCFMGCLQIIQPEDVIGIIEGMRHTQPLPFRSDKGSQGKIVVVRLTQLCYECFR